MTGWGQNTGNFIGTFFGKYRKSETKYQNYIGDLKLD